jgi:hypothetical protein
VVVFRSGVVGMQLMPCVWFSMILDSLTGSKSVEICRILVESLMVSKSVKICRFLCIWLNSTHGR